MFIGSFFYKESEHSFGHSMYGYFIDKVIEFYDRTLENKNRINKTNKKAKKKPKVKSISIHVRVKIHSGNTVIVQLNCRWWLLFPFTYFMLPGPEDPGPDTRSKVCTPHIPGCIDSIVICTKCGRSTHHSLPKLNMRFCQTLVPVTAVTFCGMVILTGPCLFGIYLTLTLGGHSCVKRLKPTLQL